MRAIRTATICHSDDDHNDPKHRRVRIELERQTDNNGLRTYVWVNEDGNDIGCYASSTVESATNTLYQTYSADCWALRASWI